MSHSHSNISPTVVLDERSNPIVSQNHQSTIRHAVYAGVFDPLTKGHWSIIETGIELFDRLTIGIGKNASKTPLFSAEERRQIIVQSLEEIIQKSEGAQLEKLSNVRVEIFEDQFLVKFAEEQGAGYIIRGLRDAEDFRQEQNYSFFNRIISPQVKAVYLMPDAKYSAVSSSAVKGMIGSQGWQEYIKPYLTTPAYRKLLEKFGN